MSIGTRIARLCRRAMFCGSSLELAEDPKSRARAGGIEKIKFTVPPIPRTTGPEIIETRRTDAASKQLLSIGDQTIKIVKDKLPFGAGNILTSIEATGGRALETRVYARSCEVSGGYPSDVKQQVAYVAAYALAAQGGNCGEFSHVTATVLNQTLPRGTRINICGFKGLDHSFVVIGDTNDPKKRNQLVVVDAWPPAAQALILKDFKFGGYKDLFVDKTFLSDGTDLVKPFLARVKTPKGKPAKDQTAPYLRPKDITRATHLWADTHCAENADGEGIFITYEVARR